MMQPRSAHSRVTNSLSSFEGLRPSGPLSHDSAMTTTFTYFEEEGIDGGIYCCHVIDGQKLSAVEICIALVFDPVREVGPHRRIVPRKDPVEVSSDGQQMVVVAERTRAAGVRKIGGSMQDNVYWRGEVVISSFQMRFPAWGGCSARQLLVKEADTSSAVDGEARVCRPGNDAPIVAPGRAAIDGSAHVQCVIGGIWSVSPSKVDPLAVVWIHGDRDSAPDALVSSQEPCRRR